MGQAEQITVAPKFCVFVAMMLLLVPLPWLGAWFGAAMIHELFHCLVLLCFGKRIFNIHIDLSGAIIETENLGTWQTVICALAGPVGGLLVLTVAEHFPRLAICACVQSLYNLLPVYPLDGGRAFRAMTMLCFPEHSAEVLYSIVETLVICAVLFLCFLAAFVWKLGILPLLLGMIFAVRMKKIKIPCK